MAENSRKHDYTRPDLHKEALQEVHHSRKSTENVVMDKFGRPMSVSSETMKVLNQLPDLSFLSARTLLYNPEQRQIVRDLGAMINNRKMPG